MTGDLDARSHSWSQGDPASPSLASRSQPTLPSAALEGPTSDEEKPHVTIRNVRHRCDSDSGSSTSSGPRFERMRSPSIRNTLLNAEQDAKKVQGMFVDAEEMKAKVRLALCKPAYDVTDFYYKTGLWQKIARHHVFEKMTLVVIFLNALWISYDTDNNNADVLLDADPIFQCAEHFFCIYFGFEWTARYMSFKRKRNGLKDAWFCFDSTLVITMVLETWAMTLVMVAMGGGANGGLGNASILRMARLLRLSRMARMARLLRAMPELMILIKGMMAAMRSVIFTLLLLIVLMYVFGIMFRQLIPETEAGQKYFRSVGNAMFNLMVHGTFLDSLSVVLLDLGKEGAVIVFCFLLYILLAALTVMNMLIGVLCEVVSAVADSEKETMTVSYVKSRLKDVVKEIDQDGNMMLSKEEFVQIMDNPTATITLNEVGVDVVGLVDFADFIFESDENDEGKEISFADFMEIVLQLRGSNRATVKDIVDLRKFLRTQGIEFRKSLKELEANQKKMRQAIKDRPRREKSKHRHHHHHEHPRHDEGTTAERSETKASLSASLPLGRVDDRRDSSPQRQVDVIRDRLCGDYDVVRKVEVVDEPMELVGRHVEKVISSPRIGKCRFGDDEAALELPRNRRPAPALSPTLQRQLRPAPAETLDGARLHMRRPEEVTVPAPGRHNSPLRVASFASTNREGDYADVEPASPVSPELHAILSLRRKALQQSQKVSNPPPISCLQLAPAEPAAEPAAEPSSSPKPRYHSQTQQELRLWARDLQSVLSGKAAELKRIAEIFVDDQDEDEFAAAADAAAGGSPSAYAEDTSTRDRMLALERVLSDSAAAVKRLSGGLFDNGGAMARRELFEVSEALASSVEEVSQLYKMLGGSL
eukprot:TRINITY_DN26221_c0_g1_i1.p1 TRINITY_DN26221_c0_g1~~TRINITY_DN26221_c0_g1_i1.p1  ORF type:complete len:925 (-),score=204.33 TRINITY_DN26221_c0_g1_i1:136-2760(-)